MSFDDGWSAIHLEMPRRVPRTEYSADQHWELVQAVTGVKVDVNSSTEVKDKASAEFVRLWDYSFFWSIMVNRDEFGNLQTDMGHAVYAAGGVDRREAAESPFADPEDVLNLDPWRAFGQKDQTELVRRFEEHYQTQIAAPPTGVRMTGIYTTLVSGLIDIFGWDILLLAAGTDPMRFGDMANRYAAWMQQYFDALAASSVPVVMIPDDIAWTSGPFLHPDWYRTYVFPNYRRYFEPLRAAGKIIAYTSDGDFTMFIDDIVAAGVQGVCMEPMTDMAAFAEKYGKTHFFVGNADTRVLLSGTKAQIRAEVERCMSIGKKCPGFFLAVGNHIPPNTPLENALCYNESYLRLRDR